MTGAGHRQLDHTADLALEVWAPTEAALFEEAAQALLEVMTEGATLAPRDVRHVAIAGLDPEDRLVRWLNELIYLAVSQGFLFARVARLELEGDKKLTAELLGEASASDRLRTEVKSVTYHGLELVHEAGAWRARLVVDV